jgi:hypothetical protein
MLFAHPEILLLHPDPETERSEFICSHRKERKLEYKERIDVQRRENENGGWRPLKTV